MSALPAALARGGFEIRMKAILAEARPGTRNGSNVYIAAPSSAPPMVKAMVKVMFAQTGWQILIFDPQIPMPQRLDGLKQGLSGMSDDMKGDRFTLSQPRRRLWRIRYARLAPW